jgi:hypothetical protein
VAAANFGHDEAGDSDQGRGYDDLAIGVPGESLGRIRDAGVIQILYGTPTGLSASGNQLLSQASPGVLGAPGREDQFGWYLHTGNFGKDSGDGATPDLATGAPGEQSVNILYSAGTGLTAASNQRWKGIGYVLAPN